MRGRLLLHVVLVLVMLVLGTLLGCVLLLSGSPSRLLLGFSGVCAAFGMGAGGSSLALPLLLLLSSSPLPFPSRWVEPAEPINL